MVKAINPSSSSNPANFAVFNSTLYFSANDGTNGTELWQSDGTASGTVLAKDINPGSASSSPQGLRASGSTLFFSADDGTHGRQLWAVT
jgi:ELWxxDGT repeat protein